MKAILIILALLNLSFASVVQDYLNDLKVEAKKNNSEFTNFDTKRGETIFTSKHIGKKGKEISCSSCHGNDFTKSSQNFFTGKVIKPLSPKTNPKRLSKLKTIKKWLRRNFNDVYKREGTAQEKGDVLTYILSKE
jgi:cytochrome c553